MPQLRFDENGYPYYNYSANDRINKPDRCDEQDARDFEEEEGDE